MDQKAKKVAQVLQNSIKYSDSVNEVFFGLRQVAQEQPDYFNHFGADFLIKLAIYIYSLKTTGDFKSGEKMVNNLKFAQLLTTNNESLIVVCKSCGGFGFTKCKECKGYEVIECPECDGNGEVSCEWCDEYDIEGGCEECDGKETVDCKECQGDGVIDCPSCDKGEKVCEKCEGKGEREDQFEVVYTIYFIATWNKKIQDLCELRVKTLEPLMSDQTFYGLNDEYLQLDMWDSSAPINIDNNKIYCIDYSDEPKMFLRKNMFIRPMNSNIPDLEYME